jgi:hypothetical protein
MSGSSNSTTHVPQSIRKENIMAIAKAAPGKTLLNPTDHTLIMIDHQSQMSFATKSNLCDVYPTRRLITFKVCLRTLNGAAGQTFLNDQESRHEHAIGEFRQSIHPHATAGRLVRLAGTPRQGTDVA